MIPEEQYEQDMDATQLERPGPDAPDSTAFVIENDSQADWALRKLGALQSDDAEREAFVTAELARLEQWEQQQTLKSQRAQEYFTSLLRAYYARLRQAGKVNARNKTYSLPHGKLSMRTHEPQWLRDAPALLAWADELGLVLIKKELDWPALKARLIPDGTGAIDAQTGEVIPGLTLARAPGETFAAKPALDG
jgi:Bacteriophage Mu Gam like protein